MTATAGIFATGAASRHHFLEAAGATALAEQALGPAPHPKGPKAFLDDDQVELDAAYDQAGSR